MDEEVKTNSSDPLWLPKGSVRSILAIMFALPIPVLFIAYGLFMQDKEMPERVYQLLLVLIGLVTKVMEMYFSARTNGNGNHNA